MLLAALLLASAADILKSTDVREIEKFVMSDEVPAPTYSTAKLLRGQAYARLGAMGTAESLAAVARIEAAAKTWKSDMTFRPGRQIHPGWHMSDMISNTDIRAVVNGRTYAVIRDFVYGDDDLLLVSSDHPERTDSWSPPHLIPMKIYRGMRDLKLRAGAGRNLTLSWLQDPPPPRHIMEGTQDPGAAAPQTGPQEMTISIDDVLRDSDGDGFTDVEEERLGLRPRVADSDGDGIPDGLDPAPDFAPGTRTDEDVILEKAIFATYGLTGTRYVMFATSFNPPRPVQVWGLRGHVLYHPPSKAPYGRIGVSWKILAVEEAKAEVELWDSEGPLAGGGIKVWLRKIDGQWYVVDVFTTWIS